MGFLSLAQNPFNLFMYLCIYVSMYLCIYVSVDCIVCTSINVFSLIDLECSRADFCTTSLCVDPSLLVLINISREQLAWLQANASDDL